MFTDFNIFGVFNRSQWISFTALTIGWYSLRQDFSMESLMVICSNRHCSRSCMIFQQSERAVLGKCLHNGKNMASSIEEKKCSAHKEQIWPECKLGFTPQYSRTTFSFSSTVKQRRMGGLGKWGMAEHTTKYTTKYQPQRQMEVATPTHSSEKLGLS